MEASQSALNSNWQWHEVLYWIKAATAKPNSMSAPANTKYLISFSFFSDRVISESARGSKISIIVSICQIRILKNRISIIPKIIINI